jgi:hypothetical protein
MSSRAEHQASQRLGHAWADRTRLLRKATAYAFSLDVTVKGDGPFWTFERQQPGAGLRHLFGQPVVEMPGGVHCEVPTGEVFAASGELGDGANPSSNWFKLRVQAGVGELEQVVSPSAGRVHSRVLKYATSLTFACTGVLDLAGGMSAYRRPSKELSGTAFMTSTQESTTRTYRWLERRQLFGVGQVHGTSLNPDGGSGAAASTNGWILRFSFDLYGAD